MVDRRRKCGGRRRPARVAKQCQDTDGAATTKEVSKPLFNQSWKSDHDEVVAAIASLYADGLKPFGRILRKRVAERAAPLGELAMWVPGSEEGLPRVDMNELKAMCDGSNRIIVEPEQGGDWSALFVNQEQNFVDVYSSVDIYPPEMWEAFSAYLNALTSDEAQLPTSRYCCAHVLEARALPFFEGRSLGQLCHIVQLAISHKKIIGYAKGAIVPYAESQSMRKEQCAMRAQPCTQTNQSAEDSPIPLADWETARRCLRELLNSDAKASHGIGMVPLSNVKRVLKSRFRIELSETMLGHSKLSELLQDYRFGDICTVKLQKHGYIVIQAIPQDSSAASISDRLVHIEDRGGQNDREPQRVKLSDDKIQPICGFDEPLTLDLDEAGIFFETSPSPGGAAVHGWPSLAGPLCGDSFANNFWERNTFIHAALPPPTPLPNTRRRAHSLPKNVGSNKSERVATHFEFPPKSVDFHRESDRSTADSAGALAGGINMPATPSPFCECQRCFVRDELGHKMQSHGSCETGRLDAPTVTRHFSGSAWPSASPCAFVGDSRIGSIALSKVLNTFIQSPLPPPTPSGPTSIRRARSLPKNFGSNKDAWEATCQALGCTKTHGVRPVIEQPSCGWQTTPSIYASSPGFVPPAPAFTAALSSCIARSLISLSESLSLSEGIGYQTFASSGEPRSIICLADLVH